jgi:hypothetical protein
MDVFKADAFSLRSLTSAINQAPYVPGRIGQMGLFRSSGITTTAAQIEIRDGVLYLIEARPRGADPKLNEDVARKMVPLNTVHLPVSDRVEADEVQNIRAFGTENVLQTIQGKVDEKLTTIRQSFEATLEWHRLGALKGIVLDVDGSTELYNLYTVFEVSKLSTVYFDLSAAEPSDGDVRKKCHAIQRLIEDELGAATYTGIHGFVGKTFMDNLVSHKETLKAYDRWMDGQALRESFARRSFAYAGIMFEEYRGKVGGTQFIGDEDAEFFPTGVPDLFRNVYAPANYIETVNTVGLPFYAKQTLDRKGRFVELDAQSNPLHYCTRPRVLISGQAGTE